MSDSKYEGVDFPLESFQAAATHLRRPFTPEAVKWKVQTGKMVVPYIDARLVIERLNLVVPHLWHDDYEPVGAGLLCRLTVDRITRLDVGSGYKGKGLFSDAFKRAAVKFGIGVFLYALPKLFLDTDKGHLRDTGKKDKKGNTIFALTDKGEEKLRKGYGEWLEKTGAEKFGPALDHGDVLDAIGDTDVADEDSTSEPAAEAEPPKLSDPGSLAHISHAKSLYQSLNTEQRKGLTKAAFARALAGAERDREQLDKLVADLEGRSE